MACWRKVVDHTTATFMVTPRSHRFAPGTMLVKTIVTFGPTRPESYGSRCFKRSRRA